MKPLRLRRLFSPPERFVALAGLVFLGLRVCRAQGTPPDWVAHHAADLLCLPLVLGLALACHRRRGRPVVWRMPRWHGLLTLVIYASVFEGVLPSTFGRGTADPWDVVAYCAGWAGFELLVNRPGVDVGGDGHTDGSTSSTSCSRCARGC